MGWLWSRYESVSRKCWHEKPPRAANWEDRQSLILVNAGSSESDYNYKLIKQEGMNKKRKPTDIKSRGPGPGGWEGSSLLHDAVSKFVINDGGGGGGNGGLCALFPAENRDAD